MNARDHQPPVMKPGEPIVITRAWSQADLDAIRAAAIVELVNAAVPEHTKDVDPRPGTPDCAVTSGVTSTRCWHGCGRCRLIAVAASLGVRVEEKE